MLAALANSIFFFFNDTATTEIYTLSLHDALPIWVCGYSGRCSGMKAAVAGARSSAPGPVSRSSSVRSRRDRKSTRLNSSHDQISYAVFCLKKKKKPARNTTRPDHDQPVPTGPDRH